jgi:formylglycine-generating enzyme required for sulfatase activity
LTATELLLRDPLGERALASPDLPVSLGGPGNTVVLPGAAAGTLAWIALHDGQLYLQPADGSGSVSCNGVPLERATWLRDGDVVEAGRARLRVGSRDGLRTLVVDDGSAGNLTVPPEAQRVEVVAGSTDADEEHIAVLPFRKAGTAPRDRARHGRRLVLGLAVLFAAAAAWFLATGRAFTVETDPAGAALDLRGGFTLGYGQQHFARPGLYEVEIAHPGYETLRAPLRVSAERNQAHRYALRKLPGLLQVASSVPGTLSADGRELGPVPGEFELAPGRHRLRVQAPRHQPFEAAVDIQGAGQLQNLEAVLVPAWAPVQLLSEPAGAAVLVDGRPSGTTPARLELDAGTHRLELRHAGFKPWALDVQVVANQAQTIGPVRLGIPDGTLQVRTEPAGAAVSVGGAFRGRSPVSLAVRPDVPLDVVATRDGYEAASGQVSVASGQRRELALTLAPILGEVTVRAEPAGAEVFANGRLLGQAGQTFRLPSTRQDLEVRAPGYRTHREALTPRPGLPKVVEVRLAEGRDPTPAPAAGVAAVAGAAAANAPPAPGDALPATIRTRSGAELRLIGPATFTMGSPRRESGRRANESQRAVELRRRAYLGTREVTNAEFRQFRPQHRSGYVGQSTLELERQPVVNVSWQDAAEFCNWLSQQEGLPPAYQSQGGRLVLVTPLTTGYRLATEAEWEWAARANRDGSLRKYPWGDSLPVPAGAGNFGDRRAQALLQTFLDALDDGHVATANVGSFAANPLGFHDLGGNVAEWTSDTYGVQPASPVVALDPVAATPGNVHVIRGSSWRHATVTELRAAFRDDGSGRRDDVGLRIARYAE